MKFTFSAVLALALAPACVQTHTLRKLAEYKYTEDLECQPEFCVGFRDRCQQTSTTGGWKTQFGDSFCSVDLTSQGDTEITCDEECIPPTPPTGPVYTYTADMQCQPELCAKFDDFCEMTAGTGGVEYTYSDTFCSVAFTGIAELTCSEECIPPAPPTGPVYKYYEDMECKAAFCAALSNGECQLTAGSGDLSVSSDGTTCAVDFSGTGLELTCTQECIDPASPQGIGTPASPQDSGSYEYPNDSDTTISMPCQVDFCNNFSSICTLTGNNGAYTNCKSQASTTAPCLDDCKLVVFPGSTATCTQECINPAPQNIGAPASPQDTGSYEYPNDSDANIEMHCQVEFCDDFGTICTLSSSNGAYSSYRHNTLSNSTSCKVVVRPENTVTCTQECINPAPQNIGAPASPQDTGSYEYPNDSDTTISMPCQVDFCDKFSSICSLTGDNGGYTNCGSQASTTAPCLDDCKLVVFPGSTATCTEECVSPGTVASPQATGDQPTYGDPEEVVRMECEWDFCSRYRDICNVSSEGTAFASYSFDDPTSDCSLVVSAGTTVTCTEECVPPASTE